MALPKVYFHSLNTSHKILEGIANLLKQALALNRYLAVQHIYLCKSVATLKILAEQSVPFLHFIETINICGGVDEKSINSHCKHNEEFL